MWLSMQKALFAVGVFNAGHHGVASFLGEACDLLFLGGSLEVAFLGKNLVLDSGLVELALGLGVVVALHSGFNSEIKF